MKIEDLEKAIDIKQHLDTVRKEIQIIKKLVNVSLYFSGEQSIDVVPRFGTNMVDCVRNAILSKLAAREKDLLGALQDLGVEIE